MAVTGPAYVTHRQRLWLYAVALLVLAFLFVPTLIVIPMSFSDSRYLEFPPQGWSLRWYAHYYESWQWRAATVVSLKGAFFTALLTTPLGTAAAYGLRAGASRGVVALRTMLALPMLVPVILIAIGIYYIYARAGLNGTITGLVLAHTTLALPLVVVTVTAGLKNYDMTQEMVARSLGASRLWAFLTVTLPQIRFSVISAALFAFITSLDEVVIALFITSGGNATIQRRMFTALRDEIDPTIAVVSTCLVMLSALIVLLAQALDRRGARRS